MVPTTRDRTDELQALEELWAAPALRRARLGGACGRRGSLAFPAFSWSRRLARVLRRRPRLPPDPEHGHDHAGLGDDGLDRSMLLHRSSERLALGPAVSRLGFGLAALAGPLGIALAIDCRASEHHWATGGWPSWRRPSR